MTVQPIKPWKTLTAKLAKQYTKGQSTSYSVLERQANGKTWIDYAEKKYVTIKQKT
jgi:hypothetical protein